ncbi:MAG: carboxypeptidase regulatory-like domain-containing protein, partial [Oscillospiraceae bacterium]
FDTVGGSIVTAQDIIEGKKATKPTDPTKADHTFGGWYYNNTKVEATTTVATLIPLDDTITILLTAHWSAEPGKAPDISGTVEHENGSPVKNANVKLTQGSETKYGPVTTNAQGQYLLPNLKPGIYNLVAESGNQIVTVIVTVEKIDLQQKLILPATEKNSILEVPGSDTPPVVVGNLEEVADGEDLNGATSLTITLTVQKEAEQTSGKPEHTEIRQTAGANANILFLDAVLTKQVDANPPENIGKKNSVVLELVIPFDLTGKENIRVYRHHTDVDAFTALNAKPAVGAALDKTYYIDANAGRIHVYAQKFSAYAIAYDKKSGSSETSYYTITPKSSTGGQITPDKSITVRGGESAAFNMVAHEGYQIADVKVDGRSVGVTSEYIFTNIWSDRTIEVIFKKTAQLQPPTTKPEQTLDSTTSGHAPTDNKPNPPDNSFNMQKEDIKDDITHKRDEAITALPDSLTNEQRQKAIDELNKICDDALNAIDSAKSAGKVSDILNDALQAYRSTIEKFGGEISGGKPDTQKSRPFILLSALLALASVLPAVLTVFKKCTKKRKLLAILGAVAAVLIFLFTTGWSGIAFANLWTLAVALAAALPAFVCIMLRKEDEETDEETDEDAPQ